MSKNIGWLVSFLLVFFSSLAFSQGNNEAADSDSEIKYASLLLNFEFSDNAEESFSQPVIVELDEPFTLVRGLDDKRSRFIKLELTVTKPETSSAYHLYYKLYSGFDKLNWDLLKNSLIAAQPDVVASMTVTDQSLTRVVKGDTIKTEVKITPRTVKEVKEIYNGEIPTVKKCDLKDNSGITADNILRTAGCCTLNCGIRPVTCCGGFCCDFTQSPDCCCQG